MKRLGLALMVVALAFLMVGQATASFLAYDFTEDPATPEDDGTYNFTGFNTDDTMSISGMVVYFSNPVDLSPVNEPVITSPTGWSGMFFSPLAAAWYMTGSDAIGPESALGGFLAKVQFVGGMPDPVPSFSYTLTYEGGAGQVQGNTRPIPEPATLLLIGVGLVAIAGYAAKKKKE
jgi:hypothetical protein